MWVVVLAGQPRRIRGLGHYSGTDPSDIGGMASGNRNRRRRFDPERERGQGRPSDLPEDEVDLHGCTVEQAERRLLEELTRFRAAGRSPVLVITGRGYGSQGGNGVLKGAMTRWLEGPGGARVGVRGVREVPGGGALEVELGR